MRLTLSNYLTSLLVLLGLFLFYYLVFYQLIDINLQSNFTKILTSSYTWYILKFTFLQALLSTVLSILGGIIVAKALDNIEFKAKPFILKLLSLTFVLPTLVVIFALIGIYGYDGLFNQLFKFLGFNCQISIYGLTGILLAHTFYNLPFATKLLYNNLRNIPEAQYKLANQLNLKGWRKFYLVEWQYLKLQIISLFLLIFMLCFTSFAIILTLGGGPRYTSLEVAIYQALIFEFDINKAAVFALLQILCCLSVFLISRCINSKVTESSNNLKPWRPQLSNLTYKIYLTIIILLVVYVSLPLLEIIYKGLTSKALFTTLYNESLLQAIQFSIGLAFTAACISLILALLIILNSRRFEYQGYKGIANLLLSTGYWSLTIPNFVVAVGIYLFLRDVTMNNYYLFMIVSCCNGLFALPFVLNILYIPLRQTVLRYTKLAESLSITGFSFWRVVDLPIIKQQLKHAFIFSSTISLGDFSVIALFGNQDFTSLPRLLYSQIGSYHFDEAAVTALVLLLLTTLLFYCIRKTK